METTTVMINGGAATLYTPPEQPLLFALRGELGLIAAKLGCGEERCGACLVLVDGEPAFSCSTTVGAVAGRRVTTLEGLGTPERPDALQTAFIEHNAAQCGFCTAGIIVRARALLNEVPDADRETIANALRGHLCRCGAHPRVLRAIESVARG